MKQITCWTCKGSFKPRKNNREHCPKCNSPYWKAPNVFNRLSWGFGAFWMAFWWQPTRRIRHEKITNQSGKQEEGETIAAGQTGMGGDTLTLPGNM